MGWFKKEEEVPEIVQAPTLPELKTEGQDERKDLPELPTFPIDSSHDNLNQEMVKSAVTDTSSPEERGVSMELPQDVHADKGLPGESLIPPRPSIEATIPEPPQTQANQVPERRTLELNAVKEDKPATKSLEPIYIRIDKFQSAQKNFEQIKDKVGEIESLLKKVKDIKSKEETELNGWTEDIEKIKARLSEVDSEIFDQL